uniref:Rod shape-determining protein RodA n=1 Tax=candidate division WOR-3 bacterium TaxID=2052148 RepID=A0A7C4XGG6_UNCW3
MKKIDYSILMIAIILSAIGLLMIYSTGGTGYFLKQFIWLGITFIITILISQIPPRIWMNFSPFLYAITILLLFAVLIFSTSYPKRWFNLMGFSLQPSEFAKLGTVFILGYHLSHKKRLENFKDFLLPLLMVLIPAGLVFLEPDFGAAQIFIPIMVAMLYWAGMPGEKIFIFFSPLISAITSFSIFVWLGFISLFGLYLYLRKRTSDILYGFIANPLVGLMTPLIWNSLKVYQQKRIISFLSPWLDPKGMSWQIIQSKIAIGSGRIFGKGFLSGTQKRLEFLPERHTDFIFSCIGEEFGFIAIVVISLLYIYLFYKLLNLARTTKNRFASLVTIGFMTWFAYQSFINMGMTIGILPVTGVPLPFISYGGSALLACFTAIGIVLAISKTRYEY